MSTEQKNNDSTVIYGTQTRAGESTHLVSGRGVFWIDGQKRHNGGVCHQRTVVLSGHPH